MRRHICFLIAALSLAGPAQAEPNAGAYLAGRQAGIDSDFGAAAQYLETALLSDATNLALQEQTVVALLGLGKVERAAEIAARLNAAGGKSQIANMALMADFTRTDDWDAIFDMLEAGHEVGPLLDGLAQAWAYVGKGDMRRALLSFDEVADTPGLRPFGLHHKALALAMVGDLEGADAIYSLPPNRGLLPTRLTVVAHLKVLCELGEFERAGDIFDRAFGSDPDLELSILRESIAMQEVPEVRSVETARDGIATAFLGLTDVLMGEANESFLLLHAQAATAISPDNADTHLSAARLLNALGQHHQAAETFARVPPVDPRYYPAEIGRADALGSAGRVDAAVEVLNQLARSYPSLPLAYVTLGDLHRQNEDYLAAKNAYDAAIEIYPEGSSLLWWLHYARAISLERLDIWDEAEADFRKSLSLNPDNPSVLNYLGYSLVDRGLNYGEALGMIEKAVAERPDSGAIVDSLAWVYYKLGRYAEAVEPMERAAVLEPNDPILNDHLGDVYWMVGRTTEARFQWRRALSFGPEDDEAERIRRKLAVGLDAVYAEEGVTPAAAVDMANETN